LGLADALGRTAARLPGKPALLSGEQGVTYAELDERVDRAAAALARLGLRPGDRVALLAGNGPPFVEAVFGAWRAGLVAVPLNVAFTADEVTHILRDSGARAVVSGEAFLGMLDGLRGSLPGLEQVVVAGAWDATGGAEAAAVDDGSLALLQYTSGTTGRPKGAMLSHANLLANHEQMSRTRLRLEESDVVLCVLPLFHIYALNVVLAYALARGSTLLLVERFDPLETLREVERRRATVIAGAPPMYVAWVNLPGAEGFDLQSVRFAVSGAAPLPPSVLERFVEGFAIPIWEGYGLTETSPVLTNVAAGDDDRPRPGSVGRPLPGVEIRLVDDRGAPVRRGDPGEVLARGPNVFGGYWEQPEATADVLDGDGWFHTGDIAYAEDGHLHLVDRKTDLVIVSGFNVYPREVEDVLHRHPDVAQAAVVGAPHPETGECVKAFVVLTRPGAATPAGIVGFCARSLARFKVPAVVEFVDDLPLVVTGKVRRQSLREAE
jgi:long-chain acyl-CoA synthetase